MDKVLVISAHPDDEILGLGGTIAKYSEKGIQVAVLIVTDGSSAQYKDAKNLEQIIQDKKEETKRAAETVGISRIYYGGLPDMCLDITAHIKINEVIESVIREYKPTIVYTHFRGDLNMDHRCVYESTLVACRPIRGQIVRKIFLYSVPSSTEWNSLMHDNAFIPNWYEDISGIYGDKKYKAMSYYKTELREYPHPRSIQYLQNADVAEGNKVGMLAAESFMLIRNLN